MYFYYCCYTGAFLKAFVKKQHASTIVISETIYILVNKSKNGSSAFMHVISLPKKTLLCRVYIGCRCFIFSF